MTIIFLLLYFEQLPSQCQVPEDLLKTIAVRHLSKYMRLLGGKNFFVGYYLECWRLGLGRSGINGGHGYILKA